MIRIMGRASELTNNMHATSIHVSYTYVLTTDSDETKRLVNSMREGLAGAG